MKATKKGCPSKRQLAPGTVNGITPHPHSNTPTEICQAELEKKFQPKRESSELLALSYDRLAHKHRDDLMHDFFDKRADRVYSCGTFLAFATAMNEDSTTLVEANFCKDRLCPMCSWRRTYKTFAQVSQCVGIMEKKYRFLFLTLTIPNCTADELPAVIRELNASWSRFTRLRKIDRTVKGFFRALEITRNAQTGEYHPHLHVIIAVDRDYFARGKYIPQDEWLQLWRKATRDERITQVDIRAIAPKLTAQEKREATEASEKLATLAQSMQKAVAEVAKYSMKDSDYIIRGNEALTDQIVDELAPALVRVRFTSFGGSFLEAHRSLGLDDPDDGDLIGFEGKLAPDLVYMVTRYGWSSGCYKLLEQYELTPRKEVNA